MKLIVGLGNPGKEYKNTRHNVGFMVVDYLANKNGCVIDTQREGSFYTIITVADEKVILLKPQRYINLSGEVVAAFKDYFKINIDDILIISDDLDLEVGKYKLKSHGSSGGHNGLKNIEMHLKTSDYKRLKIGISNNKGMETKDYVLGTFSKDEKLIIDSIISKASDIIVDYVKMDFIGLMNKYNGL